MTVGARGEAIISAGDRGEVRVLFTNRAIAEAEGIIGKSIIRILDEFQNGGAGMTETVALLRVGMHAARRDERLGGPRVSPGEAFDVLDRAGFAVVLAGVMEAVAEVLSYGSDEGELEEGPL